MIPFLDFRLEFVGVRYGIGVASGTQALHLALVSCGVVPSDAQQVLSLPLYPALPVSQVKSIAQNVCESFNT